MAPETLIHVTVCGRVRNFASRCGEQYEGLPRGPPNEPLTEKAESLFCRRPVMRRVLTCQTWIVLDGKDKVDNAIFPYSWLEACAPGEVLLGDWDVGSAGCATTPVVLTSTGGTMGPTGRAQVHPEV